MVVVLRESCHVSDVVACGMSVGKPAPISTRKELVVVVVVLDHGSSFEWPTNPVLDDMSVGSAVE